MIVERSALTPISSAISIAAFLFQLLFTSRIHRTLGVGFAMRVLPVVLGLEGTEALKAFLAGYRAAFPDLQMTIDELLVAEDKTVVFFTLTGTHEGELMGIPPTGKGMRVHGVVRSRFEDGRIVEEWEVLDQLAILTQLGIVSLPA